MDARVTPDTVQRFVAAARAAKVAVRWGSHARADWGALAPKLPAKAASANPLIDGDARLARYLDVLVDCKQAVAAERAP